MDTPTVRAVLEMGLPRTTVKTAIERKMRTTGDDFPSAESLLEAVFEIEEAMNRENRQQSEGAAAASAAPAEPSAGKSQQKPRSANKGQLLSRDLLIKKLLWNLFGKIQYSICIHSYSIFIV